MKSNCRPPWIERLAEPSVVLSALTSAPQTNSMLVSGPTENALVLNSWFQPIVLR